MKKVTSALALAAVLAVPAAQAATADFGGDYNWTGYSVDRGTADSGANENIMERGFTNMMRLKGTLKNDDGVSLNFRVKLFDTYWQGDTHATNGMAGPYTNQASDQVSLDYGFVQFPLAGWTVRVGRQEANYAFGFLVDDDRRDRILALRKFGSTTVLAGYDKRQGGSTPPPYTSEKTDGDMYFAGVVGVNNGWLWSVLPVYWHATKASDGGTYALAETKLLSGFVSGKAGPLDIKAAFNVFGGGQGTIAGNKVFNQTSPSEFVRLGWTTGPMTLEGQLIAVQRGGLVSGGFDTFSSMINNSPDNFQNATTVTTIGSLGIENTTDKLTQWLPAVRLTGKVGDKLTLQGAAGDFISKNDSKNNQSEFNRYFVDFQAHYQLTPSLKTWFTAGYIGKDDSAKDMAGNDTTIGSQWSSSVNLSANF